MQVPNIKKLRYCRRDCRHCCCRHRRYLPLLPPLLSLPIPPLSAAIAAAIAAVIAAAIAAAIAATVAADTAAICRYCRRYCRCQYRRYCCRYCCRCCRRYCRCRYHRYSCRYLFLEKDQSTETPAALTTISSRSVSSSCSTYYYSYEQRAT